MKKEQLERICFNCNYFLPSRAEATEYGICLELHLFNRDTASVKRCLQSFIAGPVEPMTC